MSEFAYGAPPGDGADPLAALMGGAGAGGMGMGAMGEMAPEQSGASTLDILNRMIEDAKLYIDTDEDEEDKLTMSKVLTMLQGYLAAEQREQQDAMQGKISPKLLARTYAGG